MNVKPWDLAALGSGIYKDAARKPEPPEEERPEQAGIVRAERAPMYLGEQMSWVAEWVTGGPERQPEQPPFTWFRPFYSYEIQRARGERWD